MTAGQTTTVNQNQPPTQPTTVTFGQLNNAVNGTSGSTTPDATVLPPGTIAEGGTFTLDGRSSSGGVGIVTGYQWTITSPGGAQMFNSTNAVNQVTTANWTPGVYNGTLTITNSNNLTNTVNFTITVVPPAIPPPQPSTTIAALASAYQALQVRSFMNLFDPTQYAGYAALEQSVTQSFKNIQSIQVNILTATVTSQGNNAIAQVTFQTKFTPANTALPSTTGGAPF